VLGGTSGPAVRRSVRSLAALATTAVVALVLSFLHVPYLSAFSRLTLAAIVVLLLLWLLWKGYRSFLWKVGRRLAFSYFLSGVLPIPMVLLLLGVAAYILAGFFLGHLYRDAVLDLEGEMTAVATVQAYALAHTGRPAAAGAPGVAVADVTFAYYRGGRRIAGDPELPAAWPPWAAAAPPSDPPDREAPPRFFARRDGKPTLAAAARREEAGVLALYTGDLDQEISRRAGLWVSVRRPDDPELIQVELFKVRIPLRRIRHVPSSAAGKLFRARSKGQRLWDDPILWWGESSGPLLDLAGGKPLADHLMATLNSTPRLVLDHLFASSGDVDSSSWVALLLLFALLFDVYLVATLMAVIMIFSLSRAVNRMSQATAAVRAGDFGVRIPVRRRDQVGELQRSFNEMAANLETLVATAAQKEVLEKELAIARDLQKSLIPRDLPVGEGVEFATLFEPSAAIGGDYFDVLRLAEDQLAVIIADVSGHGLSTGLRMAMLKAALLILVEETHEPETILRRLDTVVRNGGSRVFVTATIGLVDLRTGHLRLFNAGHPPTYLIRGGEVREILLPGSPLGGLGHTYGQADVPLDRGDLLVWLSDGLIEATDAAGEPFGYDAVTRALQGRPGESAADVRNRLLAAVGRYVGDQPASDDRTLVVMRYRGRAGVTGELRVAERAAAV